VSARVHRIRVGEPEVRLFMSDGSERSDYMPQAQAIGWLGAPHSGVNLMSCYYPRQSFWPERRLFAPEVPHYRHSLNDQTATTRLEDLNDWTDGYYSFEIDRPDNDVVRQMEDVRRYGQDVRLSVTADTDTPDDDLRRMAEVLKPFCPMQLRVNHEANGCTWFRFARNVGAMTGEEMRRTYREISGFFIRANETIRSVAPGVTLVGCYNGPGERALRGEIDPNELPHLDDDQLGLMYKLPDMAVSLDQYGSLHYGWPGHAIRGAPLVGNVDPAVHGAFSLPVYALCECIFRPFQQLVSRMRGEPTRIDLGELDFDEDIHGPEIRAQLVYETMEWIRRSPDVIASVTFYELTDMGGLGLLRQERYDDVDHVHPSRPLLDVYRRVMTWPEFRHPVERTGEVHDGPVELLWRSSADADGLEVVLEGAVHSIDFGSPYWRRVVFEDGQGAVTHVHTDRQLVPVPEGTAVVRVFAPPPDGRNNCAEGYRSSVPVPSVAGTA
jgi:hypothetical protein